MTRTRRGVVLLNLGTPDEPTPKAVGRYLKQFLMDRWVIDIPWLLRWFFVHVLIVPKRRFASAEAYQKVWGEDGSPLLVISKHLTAAVQAKMIDRKVVLAMRYGNPSIALALEQVKDCEEIVVLPLYPQYAESSTRTAQEECLREADGLGFKDRIRFIDPFYEDPGFIAAVVARIREVLDREKPDHLLLSYHGLPERHVQRLDKTGKHCGNYPECCDRIVEANRLCYRAHCFATTRKIVSALGLPTERYSVSFQSRLGRAVWVPPYTEPTIRELANRGVKRLAVVCPSFTADCLETVEEIGMRASDLFRESGGEKLFRVPCINDPLWVDAVVDLISRG